MGSGLNRDRFNFEPINTASVTHKLDDYLDLRQRQDRVYPVVDSTE